MQYAAVVDSDDIVFEPGNRSIIRLGFESDYTWHISPSLTTPTPVFSGKESTPFKGDSNTYDDSFALLAKARGSGTFVPMLEHRNVRSSVLTSRVRNLLNTFWAIVASKALQGSFPIRKATLGLFKDTTEDREQVILQVFTEASAVQAMAFWDSLESNIKEWLGELSEPNRLTFLKYISLRIHWA